MSIIQRQILLGAIFSLVLFILFSVMFFIAFPLDSWGSLWEQKVIDLPFIYIVPSISILVGVCFGTVLGFFWKKQLNAPSKHIKVRLSLYATSLIFMRIG